MFNWLHCKVSFAILYLKYYVNIKNTFRASIYRRDDMDNTLDLVIVSSDSAYDYLRSINI